MADAITRVSRARRRGAWIWQLRIQELKRAGLSQREITERAEADGISLDVLENFRRADFDAYFDVLRYSTIPE